MSKRSTDIANLQQSAILKQQIKNNVFAGVIGRERTIEEGAKVFQRALTPLYDATGKLVSQNDQILTQTGQIAKNTGDIRLSVAEFDANGNPVTTTIEEIKGLRADNLRDFRGVKTKLDTLTNRVTEVNTSVGKVEASLVFDKDGRKITAGQALGALLDNSEKAKLNTEKLLPAFDESGDPIEKKKVAEPEEPAEPSEPAEEKPEEPAKPAEITALEAVNMIVPKLVEEGTTIVPKKFRNGGDRSLLVLRVGTEPDGVMSFSSSKSDDLYIVDKTDFSNGGLTIRRKADDEIIVYKVPLTPGLYNILRSNHIGKDILADDVTHTRTDFTNFRKIMSQMPDLLANSTKKKEFFWKGEKLTAITPMKIPASWRPPKKRGEGLKTTAKKGKSKTIVSWSTDDLRNRIALLEGTMKAGNNSKQVKNELSHLYDLALTNKVITGPQHRKAMNFLL